MDYTVVYETLLICVLIYNNIATSKGLLSLENNQQENQQSLKPNFILNKHVAND